MTITVEHETLGSITLGEAGVVRVVDTAVAERINWAMDHFDELGAQVHRYGCGTQGQLIAVLEYMGIDEGITRVSITGEEEPPEGATFC